MLYKVTAWEVDENGKLIDPVGRVNMVDLWDAKEFIQDTMDAELEKMGNNRRLEFIVSKAQ